MQTLAQGGYTADAVKAALLGNRTLRFKYERYNKNNVYQADFATVESGSVAHAGFADIKRTAKIKARDDLTVDWLNDRIKPRVGVVMPDAGVAWFSLGLLLMSSPGIQAAKSEWDIRNIDAYDQTVILTADKVGDRYVVAAGSNVITAVSTVLTGAGVNLQNLSPTTKTLPNDRDWPPGTSKLSIVNDLLGSINYYSLWFNGDGYAMGLPYVSPTNINPGWSYYDDAQSMLHSEASSSFDMFSLPNHWVGVVSEPDQTTLRSEYTNTNPVSPTSTVARGITITDFRSGLQAVDQASLDGIIQRIALEASQVYEKVTINTGIMPMHEHLDVLNVRFGKLGISSAYQETAWELPMDVGGTMKHSLRRLVTI